MGLIIVQGVVVYEPTWEKFRNQVQRYTMPSLFMFIYFIIHNCSTGQNIEVSWGQDFHANEWQLALLLVISISPLILLRKTLLRFPLSHGEIIKVRTHIAFYNLYWYQFLQNL